MRGSTALLVAGALTLTAGLAGTSLAADDPARDAPSAEVTPVGEGPTDGAVAPVTETESRAPLPSGDAGRDQPELETEALGGGEDRDAGRRGPDRGADEDDGDEKLPLADVGVTIEDFEFKPKTVTVAPGDEVTWTNRDTAQHNAVGEGKADFDTGLLAKGERGTVPFNDTGTFDYLCTVHPDMKGKVVVRSGGSGGGSGKGGTSDTGGTTATTDSTTPITPSGTGSSFGGPSSSGGGSLPNTGQSELPLLLLGTGLIVFGLLARAFHEFWIWR